MRAEFELKPSELQEDWLLSLKKMFKGQDVKMNLVVESLDNDDAGQVKFQKAVEDIRNRTNLVSFTMDEFKAYSKKLMASK